MSAEEKARLEALKAKGAERTPEDNIEFEALLTKALSAEKGEGADAPKYSEAYVKQLRDEAAKARIKAKELAEQQEKFSSYNLEEIEQWKREKDEHDRKKLEEKGEFQKIREQLQELHKSELNKVQSAVAEKEARVKQLEAELDKTVLANDVANAAAMAKAWNPKLVEMVVMQNTRIEFEDGRRVVRVLDSDGSVRIDIKTGLPMTTTQYIEVMKQSDEYASLFSGSRVGGSSNSANQFQGKEVKNPWKKETLNLTLQGKILKENPGLAQRFKDEAGVR